MDDGVLAALRRGDADLYDVLGTESGASASEIQKRFRKLALVLHPDKNRDDPLAEEKFAALSAAKDTLLDGASRREYDKARQEKREAREQQAKAEAYREAQAARMGEKRRAMRSDLEDRERRAKQSRTESAAEREEREREAMQRARRANMAYVEERNAAAAGRERGPAAAQPASASAKDRLVKVKWRRSKASHDASSLRALLGRFGDIRQIAFTGEKGNAAEVLFGTADAAMRAAAHFEEGYEHLRVSLAKKGGLRPQRGGEGANGAADAANAADAADAANAPNAAHAAGATDGPGAEVLSLESVEREERAVLAALRALG